MKFKLFFGMLFVFASFTTLSAQNYLPADQAVQVLEDTAKNVESGITAAPAVTVPGYDHGVSNSSAAANGITDNGLYIKLLNFFAAEISKTKNTATGYANAVAIMDANSAQSELGDIHVSIQNLISN